MTKRRIQLLWLAGQFLRLSTKNQTLVHYFNTRRNVNEFISRAGFHYLSFHLKGSNKSLRTLYWGNFKHWNSLTQRKECLKAHPPVWANCIWGLGRFDGWLMARGSRLTAHSLLFSILLDLEAGCPVPHRTNLQTGIGSFFFKRVWNSQSWGLRPMGSDALIT